MIWSFNLSHYKNEVVSLIGDAPVFGSTGIRNGEVNGNESRWRTCCEFYGRGFTGLDANGRMTFAGDTTDGEWRCPKCCWITSP